MLRAPSCLAALLRVCCPRAGLPSGAEGWQARASWGRELQHPLQGRVCVPRAVLVTACCTATPRMPHQRRDQPALAADRRAGGARCARTQSRSRTNLGIAVPAAPNLRPKHHQPLGAPAAELQVGCQLAAFRHSQHGPIGFRRAACQRRDQRGVAAQSSSPGRGAVQRHRAVCDRLQARPVQWCGPTTVVARPARRPPPPPAPREPKPARRFWRAWPKGRSVGTRGRGPHNGRPADHCLVRGRNGSGTAAKGSRRRRRSASCMAWGSSVSAGSLGMAASHVPACAPPCERSKALEAGGRAGSNTRSR